MSKDERISTTNDVEEKLLSGEMEILGRMPYSSNLTLLVEVGSDDSVLRGIYKPGQGERPLWDFGDRLYRREVAAYELSKLLNWNLIPPTILRDGPLGEGSVQLFVEADFSEHYFTLYERDDLREQLIKFFIFDVIANNTDRKSGHILIQDDTKLWGIDNGLTFHEDPKLRTVIWDFGGAIVDESITDDLGRILDKLEPTLSGTLSSEEIKALRRRIKHARRFKEIPEVDPEERAYPWPLV